MARSTTTALLRGQASRQRTLWAQEDSYLDYAWSMSDKSPETLAAYINHYNERATNPQVEADKVLTYQKRISAANKAFTSNAIQRASIDVIEGRGSEQTKLDTLSTLYEQAYENGDYDLAQGLRLQIDNQLVKMANASQTGSGGSGGSGSDTDLVLQNVKDLQTDIKRGNIEWRPGLTINDIADTIATQGNKAALDLIARYTPKDELADLQNSTPLQVLYSTVASNYSALIEYAQGIADPYDRRKALSDIEAQKATETIKLGSQSFKIADLEKAAFDEANGNPSMRLIKGDNGYVWQKNNTVENSWQFDTEGKPVLHQRYGDTNEAALAAGYQTPGRQIGYKLDKASGQYVVASEADAYDKNGKLKKGIITRDDIIRQAGFAKGKADDTSVWEADARMTKILEEKGISVGPLTDANFVSNPDGSVAFRDGERLFEFAKNDHENFTRVREVIGESNQSYMSRTGTKAADATTELLGGNRMLRDLQSNVSSRILQGAGGMQLQQAGTSNVLQQAANAQFLNNARAEQLRVQQVPQVPSLSVTALPPPTAIRVNDTRYTTPLAVVKPVAPTLTVRPTAPATTLPKQSTTLQGAGSVQGGGVRLQGGSTNQGGSLRVR